MARWRTSRRKSWKLLLVTKEIATIIHSESSKRILSKLIFRSVENVIINRSDTADKFRIGHLPERPVLPRLWRTGDAWRITGVPEVATDDAFEEVFFSVRCKIP